MGVLATSPDRMSEGCEKAGAGRPTKLNFMLTDGNHLIVLRWTTPFTG